MKPYLQALRDAGARLDALSAVGIGIGAFGAALFVSAVLPAREEAARLRAQLARVHASAVDPAGDSAAAERGRNQLATFTRNFPTLSEAPGWILRMHQIAANNDLALETGEYRLTNVKDGGLARYQVTLPLRGGYASCARSWSRC